MFGRSSSSKAEQIFEHNEKMGLGKKEGEEEERKIWISEKSYLRFFRFSKVRERNASSSLALTFLSLSAILLKLLVTSRYLYFYSPDNT